MLQLVVGTLQKKQSVTDLTDFERMLYFPKKLQLFSVVMTTKKT